MNAEEERELQGSAGAAFERSHVAEARPEIVNCSLFQLISSLVP